MKHMCTAAASKHPSMSQMDMIYPQFSDRDKPKGSAFSRHKTIKLSPFQPFGIIMQPSLRRPYYA